MRRPQNGRSQRKYFFLAVGIFKCSLARERMHWDALMITLLVVAVASIAIARALAIHALEDLPEERAQWR